MTPEQKATLLAKLGGSNVQQVNQSQPATVATAGPEKVSATPAADSSDLRRLAGSNGAAAEVVSGTVNSPLAQAANNSASAPLTNAEQIVSRISELQEALTKTTPGYERILQVIHTALSKDEALTHLLTEEQVGVIVSGLSRKKNVVIAAAAAKSTSKNKQLSKLTAEDL